MKKIYLTLLLATAALFVGCSEESETPFQIESVTALDIEGELYDKTLVTSHNGEDGTVVTYTFVGGSGSINGDILTTVKRSNAKLYVEAVSPAGEVAEYTYIYFNEDVAPPVITSFTLNYKELEDAFYGLELNVTHTGDENCNVTFALLDEDGEEIAADDATDYGQIIYAYGTQYYAAGTSNSTLYAKVEDAFGDTDEATTSYTYVEVSYPNNYYIDETEWLTLAIGTQNAYDQWRGYTPDLPCVLLIGNSISINYTPYIQDAFTNDQYNTSGIDHPDTKTANVYRVPENAESTEEGIKQIANYLTGLGGDKWDVVHLNYGLHDLKKTVDTSKCDVSIADYKANLRAIFNAIMTSPYCNGEDTKIIWASTTWYPDGLTGPIRTYGDEITYNAAAKEVCEETAYKDRVYYCDDHHAVTNETWGTYWTSIDVHPNTACYKALAAGAVELIKADLEDLYPAIEF
ncbi:MAG: SGNH/GDSL hydrolase family protein [Rikenellaceae bacterium]